ncbi:uncharacterized protein LOC110941471 [Helianthus annuus]|uniref:uncharacterized protein LOC110941471 n=1 Tax=Helianthus annuus TaxID=4232 RepID=UPI0016533435|nr:uncharacterized protein LOC110941471 [Helianthus annuus]XP_035846634.1 uncharacterized protein LOC110941471 [Helianthus annuus]XP_035846635.1 uncharacterized protein LOC110941471 [Helianthus annuus]
MSCGAYGDRRFSFCSVLFLASSIFRLIRGEREREREREKRHTRRVKKLIMGSLRSSLLIFSHHEVPEAEMILQLGQMKLAIAREPLEIFLIIGKQSSKELKKKLKFTKPHDDNSNRQTKTLRISDVECTVATCSELSKDEVDFVHLLEQWVERLNSFSFFFFFFFAVDKEEDYILKLNRSLKVIQPLSEADERRKMVLSQIFSSQARERRRLFPFYRKCKVRIGRFPLERSSYTLSSLFSSFWCAISFLGI